jgi:Phosphatidylinositol-4-phosphate 5-Kinase
MFESKKPIARDTNSLDIDELKRNTINQSHNVSVDDQLNDERGKRKKEKEQTFEYINESMIITEYASGGFRVLRELDGITNKDIIRSLRPERNLKSIKGAGESQGKSGSFFFFSEDKKFIIKTMNDGEL